MRPWRRLAAPLLLALVTAAASTVPAAAQNDPRTLFEQGNQHYRDGQYEQALEAYQRILETGYESGPLYYNIGNCHYKLGRLGPTILNYLRARRLMPGDEDLEANLRLMQSLTLDDIEPLPEFLPLRVLKRWVYLVPVDLLTTLTALSWMTALGALILRLLARSPAVARWGWRVMLVAGLLLAVTAPTLALRWSGWLQSRQGVVMVEEVGVQSAPSQDAGLRVFTIHEGTHFRIDQQSEEWAEIVLPDGKVGWIPRGAFEVV